MISITEKTADEICNEFRSLIERVDDSLVDEDELFNKLKTSFEKLNKDSPLFSMAEKLFQGAVDRHNKSIRDLNEKKLKFMKYIEALMIGETA